jgi:hypothetical protein
MSKFCFEKKRITFVKNDKKMNISTSEAIVYLIREAGKADGKFDLVENQKAVIKFQFLHHLQEARKNGMDDKLANGVLNYNASVSALLLENEDQRTLLLEACKQIVNLKDGITIEEQNFITKLELDLKG